MLTSPEGNECQLTPGEVEPKRRIRVIQREELAQALVDGAITRVGMADAKQGIRELGLDPADFVPRF